MLGKKKKKERDMSRSDIPVVGAVRFNTSEGVMLAL